MTRLNKLFLFLPLLFPSAIFSQFKNNVKADTVRSAEKFPQSDSAKCRGLNKELFVCRFSAKGLAFERSDDGGKNWIKEKIINPLKNASEYQVDGILIKGVPRMVCDLGKSAYKGRLYISWSDEKYGTKNKDVFLVYSDDKGENWTEPILVTYRPNHKEQFRPFLYVDNDSGYVNLLYYDKQNIPEGNLTDIYLAQSRNGGLKFDLYKLNDKSFPINSETVFENYLVPISSRNGFFAYWKQSDESGKMITVRTLVNDSVMAIYNQKNSWPDFEWERTYPFSEKIKIDLNLHEEIIVTAIITRPLDPAFEKIVFKHKKLKKGKNSILIDTKALALKNGNYVVTLYYNSKNVYTWITEE